MLIRMLVNSKYNGARIAAGEIITLDDDIAAQLITEDSAEEVVEGEEGYVVAPPSITIQDENKNAGGEPTKEEQEAAAVAAAEELARVQKALDNQYKKDELAEAAFNAGVEFPAEATKAVIIEAAVAQGKAEALLK